MIDINAILQGVTIAVIYWFGHRVVSVSEKVAVHDEKLTTHQERLKKLEDKQQCSTTP